MKTEVSPEGKPIFVHATGTLEGVAHGIMEGAAEFEVRGTLKFRLERRPDDRHGKCAKLICLQPYAEADMVFLEPTDEASFWWGEIPIEGYHYLARIKKFGRQMAISFLDVKQPIWVPA